MELTSVQLQAIDSGEPVPLVVDGRSCVLLSRTTYDTVRELLDDWHPSTMQRHMAEMMRDDWSEAAMSVYDE